MSNFHTVGVFAKNWPPGTRNAWTLNGQEHPKMFGLEQSLIAQEHVNQRLFDEHPFQTLEEKGRDEMEKMLQSALAASAAKAKTKSKTIAKIGVPASGLQEASANRHNNSSPKKSKARKFEITNEIKQVSPVVKRKRNKAIDDRDLPPDSVAAQTSITGTASAKLTYLIKRVMKLQTEEKILIFFESDNIAYYIAQALELFHVKHLIYGSNISDKVKSKYITVFDRDESVRVLLMDIKKGAHGLNINRASRVFFVNPPYAANIEGQAIKRAHRIGQTRPVYVETLILEGTIEEAIYKRSKAMTKAEHDTARKDVSDDKGVAEIIQAARTIPIPDELMVGKNQMAALKEPLQLFGRKGRGDTKIKDVDKEEGNEMEEKSLKKKKRKKQEAIRAAGKGVAVLQTSTGDTGEISVFG